MYSLQKLGTFTMLHPESYPYHKKSCEARKCVRESCYFKELPLSGLREFQEITVTSPTTFDSVEYENIHILNFNSHRKHLTIEHLNVIFSYNASRRATRNFSG